MEPIEVLKKYWGYDGFRPLQSEIIESILQQRDTLALLPTGGGKSICFQVPALCQPGICIVVSPLIALMKDQVEQLKGRGIACAAVYSGMSRRAVDITLENAANGAYKFLYLSPERLQTELVKERIKRMNVCLLAVDEAHCISQWGYDFRPSYLRIAEIRALLPGIPVAALTATATPEVVEDIQKQLLFQNGLVFQQSFERQNVSYSVLYEPKKQVKLLDILKKVPGSAIIYLRSRGETKVIAQLLQANGISADFYHGGLPLDERDKKQNLWIQNKVRVIACTNAFGMGIDKPDVRAVIHLALPDSLEAYFQEAGRAGRDGKKSYAVLLFDPLDAVNLRYFLDTAFPPIEAIRHVYRTLGSLTQLALGAGENESFDFDFQHFITQFNLDGHSTLACLKQLEQDGYIAISDDFKMASSLHVTADRTAIYDYQLRHKGVDILIKALLRAHPGVQNATVEINEFQLAKTVKVPVEKIVSWLTMLEKDGLLSYFPATTKPQLTFLKPRLSAENMVINAALYQFRKERATDRVESAIRYATTKICRSKQLIRYFGQKKGENCGICDVCTGRNQADIPEETVETYAKKIRELLRKEKLTLAEILDAFSMKRHPFVTKTLEALADEGQIDSDAEGKIYLKQ